MLEYLFPFGPSPDGLARRVRRRSDVADRIEAAEAADRARLEALLRDVARQTRERHRVLRGLAGVADTIDKFLVPVDMVADALLFLGVGLGPNALKEALEWPLKVVHSIHYARTSGDWNAPLRDLAYELASVLVPGSVLDLTNRYANRADRFVEERVARRFLQITGATDSR